MRAGAALLLAAEGNRVTIEAGPVGKLTFTVQGDQLRFGYQGRPILLKRKK